MNAIANAALRRPKVTLVVWLVAMVVLSVQVVSLESRLKQPNYDVPGTEYVKARALVDKTFGANLQFPILLTGPPKALDRLAPRYERRLERDPQTTVLSPWDGGANTHVLRPRRSQAMLIAIVDKPDDKGLEAATDITKRVDDIVRPPVRAHITGQQIIGLAQQNEAIASSNTAEVIALPMLLIVLLLVFRSVIAALIPAIFGAVIVIAGFGALSILATMGPIAASALSLSSMMGLALGVDYSLLMVARFREELAEGRDPHDSAVAAFRSATTAGRTVAFAALTLMAAMIAGLLLAPGSFLVSAVVGVVVSVLLSAISAIVVIPALLAMLGPRIDKWSIGRRKGSGRRLAATLASRALRRPALAALAVLVPLLAFGSQALAIDPGTPGVGLLPKDNRARQDFNAVTHALGPGWSVPFEVVAVSPKRPITESRTLRRLSRFQSSLGRDPAVAVVFGPGAINRSAKQVRQIPGQIKSLKKTLSAGEGAVGTLRAGLSRAGRGVKDFRVGLTEAADGAGRLVRGGEDARDGAGQLSHGLSIASAGISRLVDVLGDIQRGAVKIERGAGSAARGSGTLAAGLAKAGAGVDGTIPKQRELESGLRGGSHDLERLREPAQIARDELKKAFQTLLAMKVGKLDPNYASAVEAVGRASGAISGQDPQSGAPVQSGYDGLDASLAQASRELATTADRVAQAIPQTEQLRRGLVRLRRGAQRLRAGLMRLRSGAGRLENGTGRVRAEVAGNLKDFRRLASGARSLEGGIDRLATGTEQLRAGLDSGRSQSLPLEQGLSQIDTRVGRFGGRISKAAGDSRLTSGSAASFPTGQLVLAALAGSRRGLRQQANAVVSVENGGHAARMFVIPRTDASDPATSHLHDRLVDAADRFEQHTGMQTAVGGQGPLVIEYDRAVSDRLGVLILGLVLVSYLALIPFFRALLLPLIAIVLNVLTVAAAAGVLVLLFQGAAPLGGPGYIDAIVMLGVFGIVFGLSIDYEVFLLGRMREGWIKTKDFEQAISYGLDRTASVVTGAAAIMLSVFFAFSLTPFIANRQFGVGLFVAVLIDATVVRLVLLPAVMRLVGPATWWLPRWLDRLLPHLEAEGSSEAGPRVARPDAVPAAVPRA